MPLIRRTSRWGQLVFGMALVASGAACGGGGGGDGITGPPGQAAVASVAVTPSPASVPVSQTMQLTATTKDADGLVLSGRTVTWTSSDNNIASVSTSGLVTGATIGSVTITATSEGKIGTATVNVTSVPVASVTVSPSTPTVSVGATTQLTATAKDASGATLQGRTFAWASDNAAVATVDAGTGLVTGKSAGTAKISATSEGKSGSVTITVSSVSVANVSVSPKTTAVSPGAQTQLTATVTDANGTPLTGRSVAWTSSDLAKATVDQNGLVSGITGGTVTITATSEGKVGTASVTVTDVSAPTIISLAVSPASVDVTSGAKTVTVTAHITDVGGSGTSQFTVNATASNGAFENCSTGAPTSGTAADGTWSCVLTIPAGATPGDWKLFVQAFDAAFNRRAYGQAELTAAGFPTKFTVISPTPDTAAPTITALTISPSTVDVANGSATVHVTATITDDRSGVARYNVSATGPNGNTVSCGAGAPQSGTSTNGTWSCDLVVPRYSVAGTWSVTVQAEDAAYNTRTHSAATPANASFPTSFTVTDANADATAPSIVTLTVSPTTVNTASGAKQVTVTARVTDAQSGVAQFQFSARGPDQTLVQCTAVRPAAGTTNDGTWSCVVNIPANAAAGDWYFAVSASDAALNTQAMGTNELTTAGFPTKFTVTNQ